MEDIEKEIVLREKKVCLILVWVLYLSEKKIFFGFLVILFMYYLLILF